MTAATPKPQPPSWPRPLRPEAECRFDVVSLGEVMLRFDPGEGRLHTARQFAVWEGGGEYNVARAIRRCFGLRAAVVTALVDNPIGRLIEDLILQGGVDAEFVRWITGDGVGRDVRNGLNFTERGFGLRSAVGVYDRGHTAVSQLRPGDIDWPAVFEGAGARWFHTGGIFAGLSAASADVAEEAMTAARAAGTVVSYDLNYRPSLWRDIGGLERAREVNRRLAPLVDVMIGNEGQLETCLGSADWRPSDSSPLDPASARATIERVAADFPTVVVVGATLRGHTSATVNDWGAVAWSRASGFAEATARPGLEILDRVGGGDGFASGLIYGLLVGAGLDRAVQYGAAHGALVMTTPGDTSMAQLSEVEDLIDGGGPGTSR